MVQIPGLRFAVLVLAVAAFSFAANAQSVDTRAKHAFMIDPATETVLIDKNADVPMPPASMSKLMTVYLVFERLKAGRISLDDEFLVSERAWRKGGSKMFVEVNTRVSLNDLLHGIVVQSGNDACIVVAEALAGTEEAFAELMTRRGREMGLTNSVFKNSTGWPAEGQYMTARDIATLSMRMIQDFPEYYRIYSETEFTYNGIKQGNRNPLLYRAGFGADGLKTGHTKESGFGLASSAVRDGRRLILVVNGLSSMQERADESARLLEWGFRETGTYALFKQGDVVENADVWLGAEATVPLVIDRDLKITMPRRARSGMAVNVVFNNPVPAPVKAGTPIARLVVSAPDWKTVEVPLNAGSDIERLGMFGRLGAAFRHIVFGASG